VVAEAKDLKPFMVRLLTYMPAAVSLSRRAMDGSWAGWWVGRERGSLYLRVSWQPWTCGTSPGVPMQVGQV